MYMMNHNSSSFVGPPDCNGSLAASRVTANSAVINWVIHMYTCLGRIPTRYSLNWYPVGGMLPNVSKSAFVNSPSVNQYQITGLSPGTRYFIMLSLHDNTTCGNQYPKYSTIIAETMSSESCPYYVIWVGSGRVHARHVKIIFYRRVWASERREEEEEEVR